MEKDAFLRDFLQFRFAPEEVPSEWMTEAWELDNVRQFLTESMARMVSKTGEIHHPRRFAELLYRSLTCDQAVQLYRDIRDTAQRHEDEWRPSKPRRRTLPHAARNPADGIPRGVSVVGH